MYIEFVLPEHTTAQGAAYVNSCLIRALQDWSDRYSIPYNTKSHKRTRRITFDNDTDYSVFVMTWNGVQEHHALAKWRIVSDLNNKTSFDSVL